MHRKDILQTAIDLTLGEREAEYGPMTETMARVAAASSAVLDKDLDARDIAVIMTVMKLTRSRKSPTKADHYIDGAAYMAMAGECAGAG